MCVLCFPLTRWFVCVLWFLVCLQFCVSPLDSLRLPLFVSGEFGYQLFVRCLSVCVCILGPFFDEMWQNQQQAGGKENTSPVQLSDGLHRIIFTTQPFWILLIRGSWRTKQLWIIEEWTQIKTSRALERYRVVSVSCAQYICKSSWTILWLLRFRTRAFTS